MPPHVVEAARIADLLQEQNRRARHQIRKLGRILGIETIQRLYEQTLEIEANGGMFLASQGRRRSPGGVFFVLSYELLDEQQFLSVFHRPKLPPSAPGEGKPTSPKPPASAPPTSSPTSPPEPPNSPVELVPFHLLSPHERAAMTVPGKLELTLKIDQLPSSVHTDKNGWKTFLILCDAKEIEVKMRPKMFNKLSHAAANWPLWVASIAGQMGPPTAKGFELLEPNVQVFERKAKPADPKLTTPT